MRVETDSYKPRRTSGVEPRSYKPSARPECRGWNVIPEVGRTTFPRVWNVVPLRVEPRSYEPNLELFYGTLLLELIEVPHKEKSANNFMATYAWSLPCREGGATGHPPPPLLPPVQLPGNMDPIERVRDENTDR